MKIKRTYSPIAKCLIVAGLSALSIGFSSYSWASAYQVSNYFYSAVSAGDSGAGASALAEDASTTFTNPAGLVRLPCKQLVVVGSILNENTKFTGSNTWTTSNPLLPFPYTETGIARGDVTRILPALHFSTPLTCRWTFGFSASPLYGLATMYPNDSVLRYNSTRSELKIVDLSPALAYRLTNQFSIGLGFDVAKADLIYRAMAGIPLFSPPTANDCLSKNTADGWGYGGHIGLLYQLTPHTRFGFNYRSRMNVDLNGKSELSGTSPFIVNGVISIDNFKTTLILPAVTSFGGYHEFNCQWAVDATFNYTQWGQLKGEQILYNVAAPTATTVTLPWHYSNTWLSAIGATYKVCPQWLIRAGASYDQSPIANEDRLPAIPDGNRISASIGTHYQASKTIGFDVGWTHFFVKGVSITAPTTVGPQTSRPNGQQRTNVNIVAGQLTWNIA